MTKISTKTMRQNTVGIKTYRDDDAHEPKPQSSYLNQVLTCFLSRQNIFALAAGAASLFSPLRDAWARELGEFTVPPRSAESETGGHARVKSLSKPALLRRQSEYRMPSQKGKFDMLRLLAGNDDCPGRAVPSGVYTAAAPYVDTGDTTDANNTVNRVFDLFYYYYSFEAAGRDHVYSFTLTGRGPNPQIEVSTTSGTYKPLAYVLHGSFGNPPCPAGTANNAFNLLVLRDSRFGTGNTATLERSAIEFLPLDVPLYLFVDSQLNDTMGAGPYTIRFQDVTIAAGPRTKFDFDPDSKADLAVYRPSNNVWYRRSASGFAGTAFGETTDRQAPADFDGDGITDLAVFRPSTGTWFIANSRDGIVTRQWGVEGDLPVPADYDADGKADVAVYRPSNGTWYIVGSREGIRIAQFGTAEDRPQIGDYDGNGRADLAVFRPSNNLWYIKPFPGSPHYTLHFGQNTDIRVPADYDGDRVTDVAVYNPATGVWLIIGSGSGQIMRNWGQAGDIPAPADYDGDGRADIAVYRPSNATWYVINSSTGIWITQFGEAGDKPVQALLAY